MAVNQTREQIMTDVADHFAEGLHAATAGNDETTNPYDPVIQERAYSLWLDGWHGSKDKYSTVCGGYSFAVTETTFFGDIKRWTVTGCISPQAAEQDGTSMALADGWKPPKWWQFWRRTDTKMPKTAYHPNIKESP